MSRLLFDIRPLREVLEQGQLVLTPNQRLRNRIREAYAAACGPVALTPPVYSLQEWLEQCWLTLQDRATEGCEGSLVNDLQAQALWKSEIEASDEPALLANRRLLQQANEALRNVKLWRLPLAQIASYGPASDYPLVNWAPAFEQRLQTLGLISREAAYENILQGFANGVLERLPVIYLESLPDLPPLIGDILKAAAEQVLPSPKSQRRSQRLQRVAASSVEEEIRSAASWAHAHLQQNDAASIGIIVPDLGLSRDLVERLFTEAFEPQYYAPNEARYTLPFNISTGTPLGQTALVSATLQLLQFNLGEVEAFALRQLFNSPFWGDLEAELALRAAILESLAQRGQSHYALAQIRGLAQQLAEQSGQAADQNFARRLQQLGTEWRRLSSPALPSEWVERILSLLDLAGWPGSRPLDSVEYQQASQFYQLLERFASLDLLQSTMPAREVFSQLHQLANATPFQAEVKQSPIQILGTLEGEGLRFDYCWVMGMSNQAWPAKPEPNPLLPLALQRQLNMPRSSLDKEISFARELTEHYRHCAEEVIFSYPLQQAEAHMLPSSLIMDIAAGELPVPATLGLSRLYQDCAASQTLELVDCSYGPGLELQVGQPLRGGTAVLQQQSLCPFNAFASFRLGASQIPQPRLGLNAADKGSLLHAVMALLWQELQDLSGLQQNAPQLPLLIEQAVDRAFASLNPQQNRLGAYYLQLERERIAALATEFLRLESRRSAFSVVATEEELVGEFAGVNFRMRIDRVDRTADGKYLIIDYKTGMSSSSNQWLGERPDEPQLPLYALCYPQPVAGISFACLRAQEPGYIGIIDEGVASWDARLKTVQALSKHQQREDWQSLLAEFECNLRQLVDEYRKGYAAVQLKAGNAARYSEHLLPLSRLPEAEFLAFYLKRSADVQP